MPEYLDPPMANDYESAAATFLDNRKMLQTLKPSRDIAVEWAHQHNDELADVVDQEFLPRIKKARGDRRIRLEENYMTMSANPALVPVLTLIYRQFVDPEAVL